MTLAYTSPAQCNMSASGRAAQCIVNPYFKGPRQRRRRDEPSRLAASIDLIRARRHSFSRAKDAAAAG